MRACAIELLQVCVVLTKKARPVVPEPYVRKRKGDAYVPPPTIVPPV